MVNCPASSRMGRRAIRTTTRLPLQNFHSLLHRPLCLLTGLKRQRGRGNNTQGHSVSRKTDVAMVKVVDNGNKTANAFGEASGRADRLIDGGNSRRRSGASLESEQKTDKRERRRRDGDEHM